MAWSEWIEQHSHYCPSCPEGLSEEVVLTADLEEYLLGLGVEL